jgi:hypothetical protein
MLHLSAAVQFLDENILGTFLITGIVDKEIKILSANIAAHSGRAV